jgi:hypothetical protein
METLNVLTFLRRKYLNSAKDLMLNSWSLQDEAVGERCCQIAEALQDAIETCKPLAFVESLSYQEIPNAHR